MSEPGNRKVHVKPKHLYVNIMETFVFTFVPLIFFGFFSYDIQLSYNSNQKFKHVVTSQSTIGHLQEILNKTNLSL